MVRMTEYMEGVQRSDDGLDAFPVFGFAVNLGEVGSRTTSTLFQLSLHQDNCVQFEGANGIESVPCLWKSYFDSNTAAVSRIGCELHA
jgi:hypothetical protein